MTCAMCYDSGFYTRGADLDFRKKVEVGTETVEQDAPDAFMFDGTKAVPRLRRTLGPEQQVAVHLWWQTLASSIQKKEMDGRLRENFPAVVAIHRAGEKAAQQ